MLLQSVPENVREELVASRRLDVFGVLTHLYLVYCLGGVMEKQTLLKNLEESAEIFNLSEAPNVLRKRMRWRSRTQEIGATAPDSALLLKGINKMTKQILDANKDLQFRVSLARSTLGVDITPTETNVGLAGRVRASVLDREEGWSSSLKRRCSQAEEFGG